MALGEDFETAFLWEGQSRQLGGPSSAVQTNYNAIATQGVKNAAASAYSSIVNQLGITTPAQQQTLGATFIKVGNITPSWGGRKIPPKTDIKFSYSNVDYKCSLKWGPPYLLSSAKLSTQREVFAAVIRNIFLFGGGSTPEDLQAERGAVDLLEILLALDDMGIADKMSMTVAENQLGIIRGSGGLQPQLQQITGSTTNPDVSPIYRVIKEKLVWESLTGELQFGGGDGTANYILIGEGGRFVQFSPINSAYLQTLLPHTSARISAKGGRKPTQAQIAAGEDPRANYREIGIRVEVPS